MSDEPLHQRWAQQLMKEWSWVNHFYLGDALRVPVIAVQPGSSQLGRWQPDIRTLSISATHIRNDSWVAVLETLRHEMAHQYVDEVLQAQGEPPHGPAFQQACRRLRVSAAATGDGSAADDDPRSVDRGRILDRVRKLFALGESPNRNEADAALRLARELLMRHNLDELALQRRDFVSTVIGPHLKRRHLYHLHLASVLAEFFFVEVIWIDVYEAAEDRSSQRLAIHGSETNCKMAEYVHACVLAVLEPLWRAHRMRQALPGNRERLRFFAGVVSGFASSLSQQTKDLEKRALVWQGDPELRAHFRWIYPSTRSQSFGGRAESAAFQAGIQEGKKVRLSKPIDKQPPRFGGLLGDGS